MTGPTGGGEPPSAGSIRIRAAGLDDAGALARVHVDTWRATYPGIVPTDFLDGLSYVDAQSRWHEILSTELPNTSTVLAEAGDGGIVGFAGAGPDRQGDPTYRGEIYSVYVLQEHQRRGVGRELFSTALRHLWLQGFSSMRLWVLEDNLPARRFYQSLGGEQIGQQTATIGGADLTELSYGWKDIGPIT